MVLVREHIKVVLKSGKDQSVRRFHPWIFSGAIKKVYGRPAEGDLVSVFDNKDELLATGHYQGGSIAVRILAFGEGGLPEDFYEIRLREAWELRRKLGLADNEETDVFRWVCAEGDGLPGLIIDYYGGTVVLQAHSLGMHRNIELIRNAILKIAGDRIDTVYNKSEGSLPLVSGIENRSEFLLGNLNERCVKEHSYRFKVNWVEGQKTGFFIDQRENRSLVSRWAKSRKVLNLFGYTGGFSVYALGGGASEVHTVDSSVRAVELANENVALNFQDDRRHKALAADAFRFLDETAESYDLIILDPPAFAKHQNVLGNALQGYKRLNQKALGKILPGGILFTFSCSQAVSKENFRKSLFVAAANAGRRVRILYQLSQPADHPVSIFHPEGEYLKGLVLEVQ
ncbi:MAG: class I SAM-dependent rRNA methyltransferase [Bacteroidales bacterium]|nr:class I SAM-dependent rRNA methyltransferase [Bacteroidales bacterium]MBN2699512.1 class I SAM-dependent rRNA methyltransferase [Bacteroidales bacterium]